MLSDAIEPVPTSTDSLAARLRRAAQNPVVFWAVFAAVHLYVTIIGIYGAGNGFGDVFWYRANIVDAVSTGVWPVIDEEFVYPAAALIAIVVPFVFGSGLYPLTWALIVFVLDALAILAVFNGQPAHPRRIWVGWWWAAFLLLLGPTALGRVDSVSVPLTIIAGTMLIRHPRVAGALLALAGWIKIWPIAIFGAAFIAVKARWRVFAGALIMTLAILAVFVLLGAREHLFSFLWEQDGRGLQAEAVFATPWLWIGMLGGPAGLYYNTNLLTNEVYGLHVAAVAELLGVLLVVVLLAVSALGALARHAGAARRELIAPLALALTLTLIVFNKVGSPQFMSWLAPAIILGLVLVRNDFAVPAMIALGIAGLTQLIYPTFYGYFLWLDPVLIVIATARNLLLVLLWCWSVWRVIRAGLSAHTSRIEQALDLGADRR